MSFRKQAGEDLRKVEELNFQLEQEQLEESEKKKLEIRKKFAIETAKIKPITLDDLKEQADAESQVLIDADKKRLKKQQELEERNQRIKDRQAEQNKQRQEKLLQDINDTAQKVAAKVVEAFEKQAEIAGQVVEEQAEAVERQRERAEQGLSNTLKFEQEQLAQREAERVRAEKRAQQAAKIATLFNLVSAYAASGDSNALARGLVDFALFRGLRSYIGRL